jgi:hypothetical protein
MMHDVDEESLRLFMICLGRQAEVLMSMMSLLEKPPPSNRLSISSP